MLYVTADTHYNHLGIIGLAGRPFTDVDDMNQSLIDRWNKAVTRDTDEVYVLGDFGFANSYGWDLADVFSALRGSKHLVVGNHDLDSRNRKSSSGRTGVLDLAWASVENYTKVRWAKRHFVMFHFPIEDWDGMAKGYIHLHGHTHGSARPFPHRFDVGVDTPEWGFAPVSLETLIDIADGQVTPSYGHHGPG